MPVVPFWVVIKQPLFIDSLHTRLVTGPSFGIVHMHRGSSAHGHGPAGQLFLSSWLIRLLFVFQCRSALCSALVKPHLCSTEQLTTTSKLGGIRGAAKVFLFLGTAVTKLQPLGQLTPPESSYQTRLTASVSEEHINWGRVCVRVFVFIWHPACKHLCEFYICVKMQNRWTVIPTLLMTIMAYWIFWLVVSDASKLSQSFLQLWFSSE